MAVTVSSGKGAPVLLLHAFPLSSALWRYQLEDLGTRHRFIAPDLKGFGASDAPEDPELYSMASYARELLALLDRLGCERVVVVGLSMGGYIAFELLRRAPERIAGLVLADTRAQADDAEGIARRTAQQERARAEGLAGLAPEIAGALLSERTRTEQPELVDEVTGWIERCSVAGFVGGLEAIKTRPDSSADLAAAALPALIVVGEHDTLTPPSHARAMHELLSGSELIVVPGAGHLTPLESPGIFNEALAAFLGRL
jgi:pimeloyl-ACP methyl ester carboxylesterase